MISLKNIYRLTGATSWMWVRAQAFSCFMVKSEIGGQWEGLSHEWDPAIAWLSTRMSFLFFARREQPTLQNAFRGTGCLGYALHA